MKKIKVVHVEDRFHPDMGYQLNFTSKFHGENIDMHIICSDSFKLWNNQQLDAKLIDKKDKELEELHSITIHRLPTLYEKKNAYNLLIKGLLKKIESLNPDVLFVHALESYTGFQLLSKKNLFKKYLVCADTHTLYNQFNNSLTEKIYFWLHRNLALKNLKKNTCPVFYTATENKNILYQDYKLSQKQIYPYLIGTDNSIFYQDKNSGFALREELLIPSENKVILYAGKFNEPKAPHLILNAINTIPFDLSNVTIVFVGGKTEPYFSSHFEHYQAINKANIIIKDAVKSTELNRYYNMANIVVFPKENTLSALDAQLCQLPVIMVDDPTNRERLKYRGLTYTEGKVEELGKKIEKLLLDESLCRTLGKEGCNYIAKHFSYDRIVKGVENVIQRYL